VKKETLFSTVLFSLVSLVSGQGYGGAVNQTLNPASLGDVRVFYEVLGWPLTLVLAVPVLLVFVIGYLVGEWRNEEYWGLLFVYVIAGFGSLFLFPLVLLNL
jgi:hypothetical protein